MARATGPMQLLIDSLPTDRASETAFRCALMWLRELFDVDLSNAMAGVMPGDCERNRYCGPRRNQI